MHPFTVALLAAASLPMLSTAWLWREVRRRHMDRWLPSYLLTRETTPTWEPDRPIDLFIALCDHWEPECYGASREQALQRVDRWVNRYPRLFEQFRDATGRPPQHTFFYPQDEYRPEYLDRLKPLCEAGFGDVDIHLHHDGDTAAQLTEKLCTFRDTLDSRHGLLRRNGRGDVVYGFIHGNWALCNSRPDKRWCGVDQELTVLMQTGCYADFTLPAAPSPAQTSTINSIYYARDLPGQSKSHDRGLRARVGQQPPEDHLLMIQGPLALDWGNRRYGLLPRTENGDVHGAWPADMHRLRNWVNAGVCVAGRPDWRFVKLHAHGCKDTNIDTLLGPKMQQFHADLAELRRQHPEFRYHYVTAWEMAQLVHQAELGAAEPCLDGTSCLEPASRGA